MKPELTAAVTAAAIANASRLCAAALPELAKGRKTFVKGKPVMVAYGPERRALILDLQIGAFAPADAAAQMRVGCVLESMIRPGELSEEDADALVAEALALYQSVGVAECRRIFAE